MHNSSLDHIATDDYSLHIEDTNKVLSTWCARNNITIDSTSEPPSSERFEHPLGASLDTEWLEWRKFKANGVNLGGWLVQEHGIDSGWWETHAPTAKDEWSFCKVLGSQCGQVLEARYASWISTADIDKLASVGVNLLRIPTPYAAWVEVPGSQLYHGEQQKHLRRITQHAITKYGMHIIIGLHNLPGGINSLDIGEAFGHKAFFDNETNLQFAFAAVEAILNFMVQSGCLSSFTLSPINEPADNVSAADGFANFATTSGLTKNAVAWLTRYYNGCLDRIAAVDKRIPLMIQDGFQGETFWSTILPSTANIVIDTHIYFFGIDNATSLNVPPTICKQVEAAAGRGRFPVFIGEWSLQTNLKNSLAERKTMFDTQKYLYAKYFQGSSFWCVKYRANVKVEGEGETEDYWSYMKLIDAGIITKEITQSYG